MPRDDWERLNRRESATKAVREGRALVIKQGKRPTGKRKRGRRHKKPAPKTGAWSQNTVLWFGKHKGQPLHEVPHNYLTWMASQPPHSSWRIAELCNYLRKTYLPQTRSKIATPERVTSANNGGPRSCHSVAEHASSQTDHTVAESGGRYNPDAQAAINPLELAFQQLAQGTR